MPLTRRTSVVTNAVFDRLVTNQTYLQLQGVFYGDRDRFPATPVCSVESGRKAQDLVGAPFRMEARFTVIVMYYAAFILPGQNNFRKVDEETDEVVAVLEDGDHTYGGVLIHSFVDTVEYGTATRGGQLTRASRITFAGLSKYQIP